MDRKKIAHNVATPKKKIKEKNTWKSDKNKYDFKSVVKTCVSKEFDNAVKVKLLKKSAKTKGSKGT